MLKIRSEANGTLSVRESDLLLIFSGLQNLGGPVGPPKFSDNIIYETRWTAVFYYDSHNVYSFAPKGKKVLQVTWKSARKSLAFLCKSREIEQVCASVSQRIKNT